LIDYDVFFERGYMMAKIDPAFQTEFENKLFELFPDVKTEGVVQNAQLLETMRALGTTTQPKWLMENKVSRGLYAIDGSKPTFVGNTVLKPQPKIESFTVDYTNMESLVPAKDPNFVPFGNYADLENIIKAKIFYPAYISGPTGNGKSTMIEQICAKHKRPLIRVNLNMMTDEEQLIGTKTLEDGNVLIVEGPVLIAMRTGCTLLLDEIDAGSANTLLCLQPILEGKPYYFKLKNEMIVPAEGFNIFATANTKGKGSDDGRYIGTNVLNEAFLERFAVTFEQDYPNAKIEQKIIENLMDSYGCKDQEFAETLVKWADAIRRTFADGGVDETITTRRMIHIVRAFAIFKKREKAVELCCNRFDTATKNAFIDLYDKVANPAPEVPATPEVAPPASDEVPF
jgi:MoxR-like ATPase